MDHVELTEERMRRALGLTGPDITRTVTERVGTSRPDAPHGTKPLLSVQGSPRVHSRVSRSDPPLLLRQRLAKLEQQLAAEQVQHERSRQELRRAQCALAELQAHAQRVTLRVEDELATERQATIRAQRELDDLVFERDRHRREVPAATEPAAPELELAEPSVLKRSDAPVVSHASAQKPRGGRRLKALPEPKPVRWWTASYRAKSKANGKR